MNKSLLELFETAGKNDFEFNYKTVEGDNTISLDLNAKTIFLNIGNPEDKKLEPSLRDAILTIKGDS